MKSYLWTGPVTWSADLGVDYEVSFYKNDDNTKLFTLRVSPFDMGQQGWSTNANSTAGMATLELTKADGTKDTSNWMFPVTYSDNKYSVVLDAMMSAKVQAALDGQTNESAKSEIRRPQYKHYTAFNNRNSTVRTTEYMQK